LIPDELVHYTNKETALEHILYEKQIRFGLLGKTNDPKETKGWYHTLVYFVNNNGETPNRFISFPHSEYEMVNEVMMKEWKVFCLTKHGKNRGENNFQDLFSKAYCHPRLWADYGCEHTGVCLIFNGKKLNENIHNNLSNEYRVFNGSVEYNNQKAIWQPHMDIPKDHDLGLEEIRNYFFTNYKESFLKKTTDWKSEHEYRWLVHDKKTDPIYIPIAGAISGVIVGPDFPKVYETTLIMLCKELNILAGSIYWFNGMPRVNLTGIYSP
jgi:hypothetical protein